MPAPGKIQLKDKYGRVLVETETPESLIALAPTIGLLNVPVLLKTPKKQYTGYVQKSVLDEMNVRTVQVPANFAGLEAVDVPTRLMDQLFEIYDVDEQDEYVEISARHIFYRNLKNNTLWKPTEDTDYTAAAVMRNVMSNAMFESEFDVATDCTDTQPGKEFDFERKNLVECFLDPENGICAKFGLSMIRDNSRFYCLKNVGYDRGYLVESGKNLIGVDRHENLDGVYTRVAPYGKTAKGDIVWLDHNGKKYIDSQYIDTYAAPMLELYDTGLQIGKDGVTEQNIQQKLLEAGQKRFSEDEVDKPEVTMTINFIALGDTEEFAQYRGLDKVYLYDILTIRDAKRGYNYSAQVIGVEHDILTGRLISVTIGSIKQASASRKIAVWQVPEVDGRNIRLLSIQAGMFEAGAINSDDLANGAVHWVHLDAASIGELTADQLEALQANIHELIAGTITADDIQAGSITTEKLAADAVTADVIDANEIEAINAKLGIADVAKAEIAVADIDYAHVKDLNAQSAFFGEAVFQAAVGEKLFVPRLMVAYAQMVQATIGDLVIKATDGNYYHLDVTPTGSVNATQVTPTQEEIDQGHTSNGQTIIDTDILADQLSASDIYATHALMGRITAEILNVDQLFAREATIAQLNVMDLTSNTYIQSMVDSRSKTYTGNEDPTLHHNIKVGDMWVKGVGFTKWGDLAGKKWGQMAAYKWGDLGSNATYVWNGTEWELFSNQHQQVLDEQKFDRWTRTYQDADAVITEAVSQSASAAGDTFIAKTQTLQTAEQIVNKAVSESATAAGDTYIAKTQTLQTASQIVNEAVSQSASAASGSYIAKTQTLQTADQIVLTAETYADGKAGTAESNAKTYADGKASTAESNAKAYTDTNAYKVQSGIAITANGVDVTGSKHINLDVNANNYVHINNNGIDMKGSRVSVNGKDMWARDDIIVLKKTDNETTVINSMSGKHDWVLVKPYYNARIEFGYYSAYRAGTSPAIVNMPQNATDAIVFGTATWYQYELSGTINKQSGEVSSDGAQFTVKLSNNTAQSPVVTFNATKATTGSMTIDFTFSSGHVSTNLCTDGSLMYMQLICNYTYSNITNLKLVCTCDSTTSRVPCTVYYFP